MADRSPIEWTDSTWNPVRARRKATRRTGYHCEHASEGCRHCYAENWNATRTLGTGLPFKPGHRDAIEIYLDEDELLKPLRWRRPRRIFAGSMTDLFGDWVPDAMLDRIFAIAALSQQHVFQFLTKRSARMRAYLHAQSRPDENGFAAENIRIVMTALCVTPSRRDKYPVLKRIPLGKYCRQIPWPLPNVATGVSCEDQNTADTRVPDLLAAPSVFRFVSAEPLLEPLQFGFIVVGSEVIKPLAGVTWYPTPADWPTQGITARHSAKLDQIIVGGESGPGARLTRVADIRAIVQACAESKTACFVKQLGRRAEMDRGDAFQAVAMGAGWDAHAPGSALGTVTFRDRKGGDPIEWPADLRVRDMPDAFFARHAGSQALLELPA